MNITNKMTAGSTEREIKTFLPLPCFICSPPFFNVFKIEGTVSYTHLDVYKRQLISCNHLYYKTGTPYAARSGTSMSTPMISGAVALLLEAHPDMTNKEVKLKIKASCVPIDTPHARQGWGMLNIKKLLL